MSRLIRESDVQDMLDDAQCISDGEYSYVCTEDIKLSKLPTVDAVPVVRCRECKYAHLTYDGDIKYCDLLAVKDEDGECDPCFYRSGDWFCADGERRSDNERANQ